MNREKIETDAWNCETWPDWLHDIVAETNEVADRLDMSAEQAHAYAILAALAAISAPKAETVDPAAWQRRKLYDANGRVPQWEFCPASEATGHFEKTPGYEYRPLYISPVPAITDEAVEQAVQALRKIAETDKTGPIVYAEASDGMHYASHNSPGRFAEIALEALAAFPSKGEGE